MNGVKEKTHGSQVSESVIVFCGIKKKKLNLKFRRNQKLYITKTELLKIRYIHTKVYVYKTSKLKRSKKITILAFTPHIQYLVSATECPLKPAFSDDKDRKEEEKHSL